MNINIALFELYRRNEHLIVLTLSFMVCIAFSWAYPISILDEARNAEAAREMMVEKDYIVPYFNGNLRTDKPPFHYYFMILGFKLFGVNAFAARFFSAVCGAGVFWLIYANNREFLGQSTARLAFLIGISCIVFVQEFHLAVPDPYLIFFFTLSLFSFYRYYTSNVVKWLFFMYVGAALGTLAKGPVALLLPALSIFVFLIFQQKLNIKTIMGFKPVLGLLVISAITFPWYMVVHVKTDGAWTQEFFFSHNLDRFGGAKEGHGGNFLLTFLFVLLGLLPFSFFIPQSLVLAWRERKSNSFLFFCLIVSATVITFFSLSGTKLPNYTMPAYPFLIVILSNCLMGAVHDTNKHKFLKYSFIMLVTVSVLIPFVVWFAFSTERNLTGFNYLAFLFLVPAAFSILAFVFFLQKKITRSYTTLAVGWIFAGLLVFGIAYPKLSRLTPASVAKSYIDENTKVIVYKRLDSAFPFNFQRTFNVYNSLDEITKAYLSQPGLLIMSNHKDAAKLLLLPNAEVLINQKTLFENHTTVLIRKKMVQPPSP